MCVHVTELQLYSTGKTSADISIWVVLIRWRQTFCNNFSEYMLSMILRVSDAQDTFQTNPVKNKRLVRITNMMNCRSDKVSEYSRVTSGSQQFNIRCYRSCEGISELEWTGSSPWDGWTEIRLLKLIQDVKKIKVHLETVAACVTDLLQCSSVPDCEDVWSISRWILFRLWSEVRVHLHCDGLTAAMLT